MRASSNDRPLPDRVNGIALPEFDFVARVFGRVFGSRHLAGGGALAVYLRGEPVVDIWAGTRDRHGQLPWTAETGACIFSATKGLTSTVIHRLADRGLVDYDAPMAEYWKDFGAQGKANITVRQVMLHQAGLSSLEGIGNNIEELADHLLMEERLAAARPGPLVGTSAYHSLTFGWLMAGLARAITGKGMRELFRTELARPLNTDGLHLGRPPADAPTQPASVVGALKVVSLPVWHRVVPAVGRIPSPVRAPIKTIYRPGLGRWVMRDMPLLDSEIPASNGVATARGLARMYGALANGGRVGDTQFLSPARVGLFPRRLNFQFDRTNGVPMMWHLGYHSQLSPGLYRGYGHIGLGGSAGWADPHLGLSVGLVHNRLPGTMVFDQVALTWLWPLIALAAKHFRGGSLASAPGAAFR